MIHCRLYFLYWSVCISVSTCSKFQLIWAAHVGVNRKGKALLSLQWQFGQRRGWPVSNTFSFTEENMTSPQRRPTTNTCQGAGRQGTAQSIPHGKTLPSSIIATGEIHRSSRVPFVVFEGLSKGSRIQEVVSEFLKGSWYSSSFGKCSATGKTSTQR